MTPTRPSATETALALVALRGARDGIALIDTEGRIRFANPALLAAFGLTEGTAVGRPLSDFVGTRRGEPALADVVEAGHTWHGVVDRLGMADAPCSWDVTLTPAEVSASGERQLVGVFRDASEQRRRDGERAEFVSLITHDIKDPLSVIMGYAELCTEDDAEPSADWAELIRRIEKSARKILTLVSNFGDVSKLEAGRLALERVPSDLVFLARQVIHDLRPSAAVRQVVLETSFPEALPRVDIDEARLRRVLGKLVGNAIKFTEPGRSVRISADAGDRGVWLSVVDQGPGIPPAELATLFDKTHRVRSARRTAGSGLGLYIAKCLVEAHGGRLEVESVPGTGTTFTIMLPPA
jgi:signal transduction histidine kinase